MKFRVLVQARLKSQRLPAKVLEKIGSMAIVEHIASRVATLSGAGVELVFAIADEGDITLADFLRDRGLDFSLGHPTNVLKRFVDAAADLAETDYVIRLTADNPFVDREQLGRLVHFAQSNPIDYGYTADLPLGMGAEIIRVAALRSVGFRDMPLTPGGAAGLEEHHREHVTTFIRENPHLYEIYPLRLDDAFSDEAAKLRIADIRMTIDEEADLVVARRVYGHFERRGLPHFGALDVIGLAKNDPAMIAGNQTVKQKAATSVDARTKA